MKRPALFALLAGAGAVVLGGCAVGPDYRQPSVLKSQPLPAAYTQLQPTNAGEWKTAEPSAHVPRGAWWEQFNDGELNQLEDLALAGNQDLAAAAARFAQARAFVNVARSDFFPHLAAGAEVTRQRTSKNAPIEGKAAGLSRTFNTFTVPLDAGWEADLWGRVRRQTEAARAHLDAAADDVEAVKLALQAEVAADYFASRALEAERALVADTVEAYRRSLELTRNRRQGGIASDLDVAQAEAQLRGAEAQIPAIELQLSKLLHALAALCGRPATGFALAPSRPSLAAAPRVPPDLPSELLERRPDIAASERRVGAANAEIGVAHSAFYPRLRINGLAGLQSVDAGTWFDWPSRFWAVGPSLELPLFTGGRNRAGLAAARAGYDETVARYRQTVLAAFQEVEDQLAAQHWLAAQLSAETSALAAARRTLEVADNRYRAGLVTYLEVATAQNAALTRERAVTQLQGERFVAAVGLLKALGGGWVRESTGGKAGVTQR